MAHSAQAKLKSPQVVLQLGVSSEDSKVRNAVPLKWCILFIRSYALLLAGTLLSGLKI